MKTKNKTPIIIVSHRGRRMEWADLNCGSYSHEITMNKLNETAWINLNNTNISISLNIISF
jgi:hypothetical protein